METPFFTFIWILIGCYLRQGKFIFQREKEREREREKIRQRKVKMKRKRKEKSDIFNLHILSGMKMMMMIK